MKRRRRGITLLELVIALSVFFLVVVAVSSMDVYARNQLVVLQRKAKLQNELTQLFIHIQKQAAHVIKSPPGNSPYVANTPVTSLIIPGSYTYVEFWTDANNNGISDTRAAGDHAVGYVHIPVTSNPASAHGQVWYYANDAGSLINYDPSAGPSTHEVLALNILNFTAVVGPSSSNINYLFINATACWNIASSGTCDSHENPAVTMDTTIFLPMVSTN